MGKIRAAIFDLDGTLVNSIYDLADGVNYALRKNGFAERETEEFYYFVGDGAVKMIERALPAESASEEMAYKIRPDFLEYYSVHSRDKTKAYDGVPEAVQAIRKMGIKTAVVTNKPDSQAGMVVERYYPNSFDLIYGQRDGVPTKPDPTLAFMVMEKLGVKPDECVFIGDSGVDIQTGVAAGALPIGVLWGFRKEDELRQNGAKIVVSSADELIKIIGDIK